VKANAESTLWVPPGSLLSVALASPSSKEEVPLVSVVVLAVYEGSHNQVLFLYPGLRAGQVHHRQSLLEGMMFLPEACVSAKARDT